MSAPAGDAVSPARLSTLQALLDERYSCRAFLPRAVPRETIERIAAVAQRTASWCNSQPWQVAVVSGDAMEKLRVAMLARAMEGPGDQTPDFPWPAEYRGIYQERRRECGFGLYQAVGIARGDREGGQRQQLENYRFFGAPHAAIVSTDAALGVYGAIDCGAWVAQFMLAARAMGVASIAQAALAAFPDFWREQLGWGKDRLVVCGISFGYEDPAHPANGFRTTRAAVPDAVRFLD